MKRSSAVISISSDSSEESRARSTRPPTAASGSASADASVFDSCDETPPPPPPPPAPRLRVLSWNIDMDTEPRGMRARALADAVRASGADVVLLQEVTGVAGGGGPSVRTILQRRLCGAAGGPGAPAFEMFLQAGWEGARYFVALLVRRGLFAPGVQPTRQAFAGSAMGRGVVGVEGTLATSGVPFALFTAHLESLPAGAPQRVAQLARIVTLQRAAAARGVASVFAGDTNLREREISPADVAKTLAAERKRLAAAAQPAPSAVSGAPGPMKRARRAEPVLGDAWVMTGCPPAHRYTWDTSKNDNLDINAPYRPKARYDRVFLLGPQGKFPDVKSFKLIGTERLPACGKFISDHFGVLVDIELVP